MKKALYVVLFGMCSILLLTVTSLVFAQSDEQYTECMQECTISESPGGSTNETAANYCKCKCNGGVLLNTNIPFIGRCIEKSTTADNGKKTTLSNAFPKLIGGLIRIVMSTVVIVGLLAVLVGGFMVAAEGAAGTKQKGLELIKLAIGGLILVGLSGIILNLINPNFFKTASILLPIANIF